MDEPLAARPGRPGAASGVVDSLTLLLLTVKAISWPAVALIVFFAVNGPLVEVLDRIPDLISGSTKISYGGFSMEVARTARELGSPELAGLVGGLSATAIDKVLMSTPGRTQTYVYTATFLEDGREVARRLAVPSGEELRALNELEAKGLITFKRDRGEFEHLLRVKLTTVRANGSVTYEWKNTPSKEEEREIQSQGYELSPRGQRARELLARTLVKFVGAGSPDAVNSKRGRSE